MDQLVKEIESKTTINKTKEYTVYNKNNTYKDFPQNRKCNSNMKNVFYSRS